MRRKILTNFLGIIPAALMIGVLSLFSSFSQESGRSLVILQVVWFIFLCVLFALDARKRFFIAFWGTFTLYNISAWIAYYFRGLIYPPFPQPDILYTGSVLGLQAALWGYVITSIIFINVDWQVWLSKSTSSLLQRVRETDRVRIYFGFLFLLAMGIASWIQIFQLGFGTVLASERRSYEILLPISDHNIWLLYLAISLYMAVVALVRRQDEKVLAVTGLAFCWLPVILTGSRRYFVVILIAVFLLIASSGEMIFSKRIRVFIVNILFPVSLITILGIASAWTGHLISSFNEFILPQYMLFSMMTGNVSIPYDSLRGFWLMLPAFFRPIEIRDLGSQFANLHITVVGVGGNPVAEAYLDSAGHTVFIFCLLTVFLLIVVYLLVKLNFSLAGLVGSLIFLWGRSDLWITLWVVVYSSILYKLLTLRIKWK